MKAHIITSAEPLKEGASYEAQCGAPIGKARFVFTLDTDIAKNGAQQPVTFNALLCCAKCLGNVGSGRYLYGLIEVREMRESEVA